MEIRERFLEIEKSNNLNNITVYGYNFWAYNRYSIYSEFERKLKVLESPHENVKVKEQIVRYIKNTPLVLLKNIRRFFYRINNRHNVVTLVKCHSRRNLIDGKFKSIYTDYLFPNGNDTLSYESSDLYTHHSPCYTENIVFLDSIELKGRMEYLLNEVLKLRTHTELSNSIRDILFPILESLISETSIIIDKNLILNNIVKHYYLVKYSKHFWKKELMRYRVNLVVLVVSYDLYSMSLCEEAHRHSIPVIEMQHGTITKSHIAYQCKDDSFLTIFPDYIFTFSKFWTNEINISNKQVKILPIGFAYFNAQKFKYSINDYYKKTILIISQKTKGSELARIARKISDSIKKRENGYKIVYKLHPSEFLTARDLYPELFLDQNINIVSSDPSLYQLFSEATVQLGYDSTALFEGMGFGLTTYFLPNSDELVNRLVEEGLAHFWVDENDCDLIFEQVNIYKEKNEGASKYMWEENAFEKFHEGINSVLRRSAE